MHIGVYRWIVGKYEVLTRQPRRMCAMSIGTKMKKNYECFGGMTKFL